MPNKFLPPSTTTATRTAATPLDGELLYDTDQNKLYHGDGTTQGGKKIQTEGDPLTLDHITTPSAPDANKTIVYAKADNKLYYRPSGGSETEVGATSTITLDLVAEPATPAADKLVIYASALDGLIYKKDALGIVEAIGTGGNNSSSISAKLILESNASIPSVTDFIIPFTQAGLKFDTGYFWNNANPTRFTIPSNGIYLLSYGLGFSANESGARDMILRKNGTTLLEGANRPVPSASVVSILGNTSIHSLVEDDYIELYSYQNSGSTLTLYGESTVLYASCYMSILKVG